VKRLLFVVVVLAFAAGCGGDDDANERVRVYWMLNGKVWPTAREVERGHRAPNVEVQALLELFARPNVQEKGLELTTAIPKETELESIGLVFSSAYPEFSGEMPPEALAQVVYTLTQFPSVKSVEIGDHFYTRTDFEDFTPAILVESPLPFEEVSSPLRVTGTANTFEATFSYELTDTDGLIVDENFVTATSGTGTRGTFDFTTKPFTVPFDGVGSLIVYEHSAKDGSRIHVVEIPLRMTR